MAVEVGFVEGTIAATTPNGSAISMIFFSSSRRIDADGRHRPDEGVDALGGEQVLLNLVGHDAEARLVDRQARERLGLRRDRRGHRIDNGVHLGLGELRQDRLGRARAARECAGLGHRGEVAIGLRGGARGHPAPQRVHPFGRMRSTSAWGRGMT